MKQINVRSIGYNIKRARFARNMSLRELARKTGIAPKNLSDIENHKTLNIKIVTLYRIAEAFDCPIERLLQGVK